ncbi:MAG: alpha/beta fold hydrolase [Acidimicrobiales bacterium]
MPALHTVAHGSSGPTVVLVHGFTQTSASWRPVVERLAADHRLVCVDLPGHGGSAEVRADLWEAAALVRAVAGEATWVGYSLGARVLLHLAVAEGAALPGLVLLGGTAGIDDPAERAARRAADEALADRIEAEGVARFIEGWVAQPLFGPRRPSDDDLAARLANTAAGLASSLRLAGTGTMDPPLWDRLGVVTGPTVVAWGEHDHKFAALGGRLAATIGGPTTTATIAGAHHAAHLDDPAGLAALVRAAAG